jgi:hypothetical protein
VQQSTATTVAAAPTQPPLTNRADCDSIRGTAYLSEEEHQWFISNCLGGPTAQPTDGGGPVTQPTVAPPTGETTYPCESSDCNCPDFPTHAEAQRVFQLHGGSPNYNWSDLDSDNDGIACEGLP